MCIMYYTIHFNYTGYMVIKLAERVTTISFFFSVHFFLSTMMPIEYTMQLLCSVCITQIYSNMRNRSRSRSHAQTIYNMVLQPYRTKYTHVIWNWNEIARFAAAALRYYFHTKCIRCNLIDTPAIFHNRARFIFIVRN